MASLDLKKLSRIDQVIAGAGVLALIALFLPWYGVSVTGYSASVSGWSTSYGWLGALLIVAAGAAVILQRSATQMPRLPVGPAVLVLGLSVIGTVVVILRWATLPRGSGGVAGIAGYSYGPRVGIWIALIVGVVQAVAAIRLFRSSGEVLPWAEQGPTAAASTTPPPEAPESATP